MPYRSIFYDVLVPIFLSFVPWGAKVIDVLLFDGILLPDFLIGMPIVPLLCFSVLFTVTTIGLAFKVIPMNDYSRPIPYLAVLLDSTLALFCYFLCYVKGVM